MRDISAMYATESVSYLSQVNRFVYLSATDVYDYAFEHNSTLTQISLTIAGDSFLPAGRLALC